MLLPLLYMQPMLLLLLHMLPMLLPLLYMLLPLPCMQIFDDSCLYC